MMGDLALVAALFFLCVIALGPISIALALLQVNAAIVLTAAFLSMALGIWWATIPTAASWAGIVSVFYGVVAVVLLHVRRTLR